MSSTSDVATQEKLVLIDLLASLENRPYDFVMTMFPWGQPGTPLERFDGPSKWQTRQLLRMQAAFLGETGAGNPAVIWRHAIKSGNNVGKTGLIGMVAWWFYSTRPNAFLRITANTENQLKISTWREIAKWHSMFLAKDFFKMSAKSVVSTDPKFERTWRMEAVAWSEDNPDAFSGLHNQGNRIGTIFDEASGIPDVIWSRVDGMTREANTQVFWLCTGNPTRNTGRFYQCFNEDAWAWNTDTVSQRESTLVDQREVEALVAAKGEDDDYIRVFVLGEFPASSFTQLIPVETIDIAQRRQPITLFHEPLILGVDIARFGNNENVAVFRRGKDAREVPCQRWRGLTVPESGHRIASLIATYNPDAVFIDEGGVGGGVVDFVRLLGHPAIGINFGAKADTKPGGVLVSNKRAEIYLLLRDWLREGGTIESDPELKNQLISIEYSFNNLQQYQLMKKEDMRRLGRPSPDWADALALTFALPVGNLRRQPVRSIRRDYDPLADSALDEFRPRQQPHDRSYH
jgi:hypothetical protein